MAPSSEDNTPVTPGTPDSANSLHQRQAAILHPAVSDVSQATGGIPPQQLRHQSPAGAAATQAGPSQVRQPVGVSLTSPKNWRRNSVIMGKNQYPVIQKREKSALCNREYLQNISFVKVRANQCYQICCSRRKIWYFMPIFVGLLSFFFRTGGAGGTLPYQQFYLSF